MFQKIMSEKPEKKDVPKLIGRSAQKVSNEYDAGQAKRRAARKRADK